MLPGSLVWGTPKVWYAVVKAGASLRFGVAGEARNLDPNTYDFAVIEGSDPVIMAKGFRKIAEIGAPLPPVFGKIRLGSEDYRMQVWQSTARDPRTESADSK